MFSYQSCDGVLICNNYIEINGERIKIPEYIKNSSSTIINGRIAIGGYEFFPKTKKFKRTLWSIWHYYF